MHNGLLFQGFEWYLSDDGNFYNDLILKLEDLNNIGVTAIWLPPVCKATGTNDTGYGIYDLYDLGEFDQKGSVRTKYGTIEELKKLIEEIHKKDIQVYADVVLNHKAGADRAEKFMAIMVDREDRNKNMGEPLEIEGWTGFDFPGRANKYSDFKWSYNHFNGVDFDSKTGIKAIYKILGENKGWNLGVSTEKGNYDYLMFADLDLAHPEVIEELKKWSLWFINELSLDGFRLDALKHMDDVFINELVDNIRSNREDFYFLGEYWVNDLGLNKEYIKETNHNIELLDVTLHFNLYNAAKDGNSFDLRKIFDNTLVQSKPSQSVTFVDNQDSQIGQSLQSNIEPWFKEIAYGIILLRRDGYPCIFYGDYYGTGGPNPQAGFKDSIDKLAKIRMHFAYGNQDDYFHSSNLIGWVRQGDEDHPNKCAIVISSGDMNTLPMFLGLEEAGKIYADYMGNNKEDITIDENGYGDFMVGPGSISVWVEAGIDI